MLVDKNISAFGVGGFVFLMLFIMLVFVFLFVFWILMIIDCVKRDFKGENDKVVWILVLVFLGFIGAVIYYFVVKINDKKGMKKGR